MRSRMAGLGSFGRMLALLMVAGSLLVFGLWITTMWPDPSISNGALLLLATKAR